MDNKLVVWSNSRPVRIIFEPYDGPRVVKVVERFIGPERARQNW